MSFRSIIFTLVALLCAFGLGYAAVFEYGFGLDRSVKEAAIDGKADLQADGKTPLGADETPNLAGAADRRMDDFGTGPAGQVVTVPLGERYRQAYSGNSGGTGGEAAPAKDGTPEVQAAGAAADPEDGSDLSAPEGGANPVVTDSEDDQDVASLSNFQVIDREPSPGTDEQADLDAAEATTAAPSFDIVRVDPDGNTVLAGRSAPFADVEVKAGEKVIDRVTATALGEWVSTPLEPLASGDQELSLVASGENTPAIVSRQVVVVSIPGTAEQQVADAKEPVAILLDKEKGGEGRILQAPGTLKGEGQLALKLVDYDDEGAIKLSGEAPPGVPVRIYIDNKPTALVIGDAKGYWITTLDRDLPGGDYTLRLDQLDKKGETVARLETPLTRVTTPPVEGASKVDYVVVQPGNSLWRIARRLSGDGFNYVYIFEANQAQIRDPDVIYPGQVFEVPADTGVAG